jgi:class 3 adenylate cyclase
VLAADIAGYSRLMGADEVGTLAALKALRRDIVDPAIESHHGRIVKTTGDGSDRTTATMFRSKRASKSITFGGGYYVRIREKTAIFPGRRGKCWGGPCFAAG